MNNNVLLISEDALKTYSNLNKNTFGDWILPAIREAQEMGLMPIIGECLYNKICELVADGSINDVLFTAYKDLLDDKIQPYLIYKTLSNIIPILNAKMANLGVVVTNDEHVVNLTQSESDLLKSYYSERCDFYTKRLQDFIKSNQSAFPEISCGCGKMQPNLESSENSVGVWLGGSRGKKIGNSNNCICSSTEVTHADYQSGFTDGVEFQKRKLEITGFTENGRYIREDGYSEVVVNVNGGEVNNQSKSVIITQNGSSVITHDAGYTGLEQVSINVNVNTGHSDEEFIEQYQSGYTDGYSDGKGDGFANGYNSGYTTGITDGINTQKAKLAGITITQNGDYTKEDGYSAITVDVVGQAPSLTTLSVTENGSYSPVGFDGYSSVDVNVPSTGYTQEEYDEHYSLGYRQGQYFQKSLLTTTAITVNGTYTRDEGYKRVEVNVSPGTEIVLTGDTTLMDYGRYYFDYDENTKIPNIIINFNSTGTTGTTGITVMNYTSTDGNLVTPNYINQTVMGRLISNTYENGIGTFVFDKDIEVLDDYLFTSCKTLRTITIPKKLKSIGERIGNVFGNCKGLTEITIPSSVTSIANSSFFGCESLISVTCLPETPPTLGGGVFDGSKNAIIYVPAASVDAYKTTGNWTKYADRIQAIVDNS